jgi:hypothetical protein
MRYGTRFALLSGVPAEGVGHALLPTEDNPERRGTTANDVTGFT